MLIIRKFPKNTGGTKCPCRSHHGPHVWGPRFNVLFKLYLSFHFNFYLIQMSMPDEWCKYYRTKNMVACTINSLLQLTKHKPVVMCHIYATPFYETIRYNNPEVEDAYIYGRWNIITAIDAFTFKHVCKVTKCLKHATYCNLGVFTLFWQIMIMRVSQKYICVCKMGYIKEWNSYLHFIWFQLSAQSKLTCWFFNVV